MKLKRTILIKNVRETEWAIKSRWQHWVYKTQDEDKQNTTQNVPYQNLGVNTGDGEGVSSSCFLLDIIVVLTYSIPPNKFR